MRSNILNKLAIAVFIILATACKAKKILITVPVATAVTGAATVNYDTTYNRAEIINTIKSKDLTYNFLALKGKAILSIDDQENGKSQKNDVVLNIRIKKEQMIWVSVTALGGVIEVARVVITPDSLFLMNRAKKTITRKPFTYIHEFINPQVNFGLLQSIFSANTYPLFMDQPSKLTLENGLWVTSGVKEELTYRSVFNTLLKMNELTLNDRQASQSLKVTYDQYVKVGQGMFPSNLKISSIFVEDLKEITLDIAFTKIELDAALEFPFSVPKSFQLIK